MAGELPLGFNSLLDASLKEGGGNVARLDEHWRSGLEGFDHNSAALFAAFHRETLIGIAGMTREQNYSSAAMRMQHLFVRPDWRRQGVTHVLAQRCISTGLASGKTSTCHALASVAAGPFWEGMGFRPVDLLDITDIYERIGPDAETYQTFAIRRMSGDIGPSWLGPGSTANGKVNSIVTFASLPGRRREFAEDDAISRQPANRLAHARAPNTYHQPFRRQSGQLSGRHYDVPVVTRRALRTGLAGASDQDAWIGLHRPDQEIRVVGGLIREIALGREFLAVGRDLPVQVRRTRTLRGDQIAAGLDGREPERAISAAFDNRVTLKVRIKRRGIAGVGGMGVAASGVGLPQLHSRSGDRLTIRSEHTPANLYHLSCRPIAASS